jgi:hypothetical protein
LIGQRFDDLSKLIEAEGAFAQEGKAAAKALSDLRTLEAYGRFLPMVRPRSRSSEPENGS